jgi:hypothetical protein
MGALASAVLLVSHRHLEATASVCGPTYHPGAAGRTWRWSVTESWRGRLRAPSRPSPSDSQDHLPMTFTLACTILAGIAATVFVLDAITPPKH